MFVFLNILAFMVILSFLVIIHELGHFVSAKWAKITVEEFGLGYPPMAKKLFTKWGTVFSLNWIPFGGFVRMVGEDGENSVESTMTPVASAAVATPVKRAKTKKTNLASSDPTFSTNDGPFYEKSAGVRLIVVLAGAAVNVVYGVLVFAVVFSFSGIPTPLSGARISYVQPNSPAAQAGVPINVTMLGLRTGTDFQAVASDTEAIAVIGQHQGEQVTLVTTGPCQGDVCQESVQEFAVYIRTPEELSQTEQEGALGVGFSTEYAKFYPWYEMPFRGMAFGMSRALMMMVGTLIALGSMVGNLAMHGVIPQDVMGPFGIGHEFVKNQVVESGVISVLFLSGLLSISLGIMNVLPIPALDGGRAVFILLEKIVGRAKINQIEGYANYGGFIFLLTLIVLISARDIVRIIQAIMA